MWTRPNFSETIKETLVLQIYSIADVSKSSVAPLTDSSSRLLLFRLTDGAFKIPAIEISPIPGISILTTMPGVKLEIKNPIIRGGRMLINGANTKVLGGVVPALKESWETSQRMEARRRVGSNIAAIMSSESMLKDIITSGSNNADSNKNIGMSSVWSAGITSYVPAVGGQNSTDPFGIDRNMRFSGPPPFRPFVAGKSKSTTAGDKKESSQNREKGSMETGVLDSKSSKNVKDSKDTKPAKSGKDAKDTKDSKDKKDTKDSKDKKDKKDSSRDGPDKKGPAGAHASSHDARQKGKESKEEVPTAPTRADRRKNGVESTSTPPIATPAGGKAMKDAKHTKEPKDSKGSKDTKNAKDGKDSSLSKDIRDSKKDPKKDIRSDAKDPKKFKDLAVDKQPAKAKGPTSTAVTTASPTPMIIPTSADDFWSSMNIPMVETKPSATTAATGKHANVYLPGQLPGASESSSATSTYGNPYGNPYGHRGDSKGDSRGGGSARGGKPAGGRGYVRRDADGHVVASKNLPSRY